MSNTPPPQAPRETIPRPLHLAAAAADSKHSTLWFYCQYWWQHDHLVGCNGWLQVRHSAFLTSLQREELQMWCRSFGLSQVEGFEINSVKTLKQLIDRLNGSALPCARNSEWGICGKSVFSPQWIGPSHRLRWESECFAAWLISD